MRLAPDRVTPNTITQQEAELILTRDSIYVATVGETGWPYLQHRGGDQGFITVSYTHLTLPTTPYV